MGIDLPINFASIFIWNAKRLDGWIDHEDLGSLLMLECQEQRTAGHTPPPVEVLRMLDRIRHRLVRQSMRTPGSGDNIANLPSGQPREAESTIAQFIKSLDCDSTVLFEMRYIDGLSMAKIGMELGIPQSTLYRKLAKLQADLEDFIRKESH
jgi:hypothetical protein